MKNPILTLLQNRGSAREKGVYSCCSANEYVIRAALRRAKAQDTVVLVEATANQVNQDGGYTGMTPADFRLFMDRLAAEEGRRGGGRPRGGGGQKKAEVGGGA